MGKQRFLISGGQGKLAKYLQEELSKNNQFQFFAPTRSEMDVRSFDIIDKTIRIFRPHYFIHCAAKTRPMAQHEINPIDSILDNIIGTANVVNACISHKIKLIYTSTDYVYAGNLPISSSSTYDENSPLLPCNNYGWSKLGGECAVHMYKNSLILRLAMADYPWEHGDAFTNDKKNWIYDKDVSPIIVKLRDEIGIINIGSPPVSSYEFASKTEVVKPIQIEDVKNVTLCVNTSMNLERMKHGLIKR
jgi:dTDP-4-dehydrorhamnose reductase